MQSCLLRDAATKSLCCVPTTGQERSFGTPVPQSVMKTCCPSQYWRVGGVLSGWALLPQISPPCYGILEVCSCQYMAPLKATYLFEAHSRKKRHNAKRALNGNWCVVHPCHKPHHKSHLWASSFPIYNGMLVFKFREDAFGLEVHVCRRGRYFIFCSDQFSSPKLYHCLRKAITAKLGEPGCRRHHSDPQYYVPISI